MKKKLLAVSIVGNIALVAALLWMRNEHQLELREVARAAMRGDEIHLQLHAASLAAMESADPAQIESTEGTLRSLIAVGEQNIEARQRAGFGR